MRIGINIPNELLKRLEPLKPELNISQVCREALEAKAESYERMQARLESDAIGPAIARLMQQEEKFLAVISFDWQMLGWEDAASWVKAASDDNWNDLLDELQWLDEHNRPQWEMRHLFIDGVKLFHHREMELRARMKEMQQENAGFDRWLHRRYGGIDYKAIERDYMTAWTAYVIAVWERYCQSQQEQAEERRNRRQEAYRSRPQPELPEHLFADAQPDEKKPFRVVPFHSGYAPGVDPLKLNHLIGELDVEEFLDKQERLQ